MTSSQLKEYGFKLDNPKGKKLDWEGDVYLTEVVLRDRGESLVIDLLGCMADSVRLVFERAADVVAAVDHGRPPVEHEVGARLGPPNGALVELVGYTLKLPEGQSTARPGDTLHLTLVWRCMAQMETSYTVFTHLLDGSQQIVGQQDNPPVGGRYPTPLWQPGEVVVETVSLPVPADPPPPLGPYFLHVGLYRPDTGARLPLSSTDDHVKIAVPFFNKP